MIKKRQTTKKGLDHILLDKYEREIEESFEKGEWIPVDNQQAEKKRWQEIARRTLELRGSKKITVRLNQRDLIKLKAKAEKTNIPYQTLLSALVRDFVEGKYSVRL